MLRDIPNSSYSLRWVNLSTGSSTGYGFGGDNSEDDQATFLVDAFRIVRQDAPYISHAFVWNLNFQSVVAPEDEKYPFGVLGPDGVPRPAYSALVTMPKGIRSDP